MYDQGCWEKNRNKESENAQGLGAWLICKTLAMQV